MLDVMAEEKRDTAADGGKRVSRTHRWNPELLAAVAEYMAAQDVPPTEIATLETAAREFLAKRGFWPRKARKPKHNGH